MVIALCTWSVQLGLDQIPLPASAVQPQSRAPKRRAKESPPSVPEPASAPSSPQRRGSDGATGNGTGALRSQEEAARASVTSQLLHVADLLSWPRLSMLRSWPRLHVEAAEACLTATQLGDSLLKLCIASHNASIQTMALPGFFQTCSVGMLHTRPRHTA